MSVTLKCDDGDLLASTGGRFLTVFGLEKCAQDIAESLLNSWDDADYVWWNGSTLYLIGPDPVDTTVMTIEEMIRVAVEDAIERLIDMQEDDTYVDQDEQIADIRELWVRDLGDLSYGFYLRAITTSEDYIPLGFTISLQQQLPTGIEGNDLLTMITAPKYNQTFL
jgi:hypothetical protein